MNWVIISKTSLKTSLKLTTLVVLLASYLQCVCLTYATCDYLFIPKELQQRWKELQELLPVRDGVLERELEKQQKDEKLRQDFATKANTVGRWIEEQLDKVTCREVHGRTHVDV